MKILSAVNVDKNTLKPFQTNRISSFFKEIIRNRILFMMLIPGGVLLIINNYLPMFGIIIAFQEVNYGKGVFRGDWVGLKNFEFFLNTSYAYTITRNTLLYNLAFILLGLVVAVFIAIALNEIKNQKLGKLYQSTFFLPYFMSWIVIGYMVFAFLGNDNGMVNTLLRSLGMEPVAWYSETACWPYILILVNLWKYSGYSSVIYLAAIANFDTGYYEAAAIDGAGKWQQTTKITLPLLQPLMIILTLLAVGRIFNSDIGLFYTVPMDSGVLYPVTNVIDTYVYRAMTKGIGDISMAAAAGVYQSVVGFVCVVASNLIVKKIDSEKSLF